MNNVQFVVDREGHSQPTSQIRNTIHLHVTYTSIHDSNPTLPGWRQPEIWSVHVPSFEVHRPRQFFMFSTSSMYPCVIWKLAFAKWPEIKELISFIRTRVQSGGVLGWRSRIALFRDHQELWFKKDSRGQIDLALALLPPLLLSFRAPPVFVSTLFRFQAIHRNLPVRWYNHQRVIYPNQKQSVQEITFYLGSPRLRLSKDRRGRDAGETLGEAQYR